MKKRVVITGLGVLSAIGIGKESFRSSLKAGHSGIGRITLFDPSPFKSRIAGEIKGFDPSRYIDRKDIRWMDRFSQIAVAASQLAVDDAGIKLDGDAGIIIGTGTGGILWHQDAIEQYFYRGPAKMDPADIPKIMYNSAAGHISMRFGLQGEGYTVSTACASGAHAVGEAHRLIRHGYAGVMIAGGTDVPLSPHLHGAWCALRVLSTKNDVPEAASCPFDKNRNGFVLAEGAGILILEELEHALSRSANIYAEIIGYGTSFDASHITAPNAGGQIIAIQRALDDGNVSPQEIDYINAHGTATKINDKVETRAIKEVFGKRAYSIPVSSTKSMTGHTMGAAGAIELIACCLTLKDNIIPPTINYSEPDPECDLDYVPNNAREANVNTALSNSFGFGGNNAVLIIRK
ncbi:MAG TPA: beta-ketoacyl-[acyl-carrier-protein] synthase II [Nitrospirae bacterium]|nr:3-oxoacyl-[acyl-carrier-protein] synthase 2 [bacterium BMS3Abin06]HDH04985.1 beta-ketoacyl-[acyl-carrier-protein] synthase II [Nitrospirota bacterium]HDH11601.1 beta-ketoacyl-[acyl-carrier-protein] synthase II [Nitrospirota bacterium]HDZ02021.1 beta-ketoacyl-[acyl-carrier-protein] synthase II [Nitrospirota bacterium]